MTGLSMSKYFRSLIELTLATYAVTFLGLILAAGYDLTDLSALKASAVAAIPAALSVVYGALARFAGNFDSALVVDTRPGNE